MDIVNLTAADGPRAGTIVAASAASVSADGTAAVDEAK